MMNEYVDKSRKNLQGNGLFPLEVFCFEGNGNLRDSLTLYQ